MKGTTIVLLPLAVSAAVIPEVQHEHSRRQSTSPPQLLGDQVMGTIGGWLYKGDADGSAANGAAPGSKSWMDTLSAVGGYLNKGYQAVNGAAQGYNQILDNIEKGLPGLLYSTVPSLATVLQWTARPVSVSNVKPVLEPTLAKKAVFRYGPFELRGTNYPRANPYPFTMDKKSEVIIRQLKGLPQNAAILSGRMDTVFEDGSKADIAQGIYIHHLLVADVGKNTAPFAACPGGRYQKSMQDFAAYHFVSAVGAGLIQSGNDQVGDANTYYTNRDGIKSGFLTSYDDVYLLEAEIVNYNKENTTVYLQLEAEYIPDKPEGFMDASTVLFSATGCGDPGYRPPKNAKKYNWTSEPFMLDYDGVIVNNRGHLHDGGVAMHMLLNNKLVCESLPNYGGAPGATKGPDGKVWQTILSMTRCDHPVPFKRGDEVKLVSIYDVEKHPLRPGDTGGHEHGSSAENTGMEGAEEMGIFTANIAVARDMSKNLIKPADLPVKAPVPPVASKDNPMPPGHAHSRRAPLDQRSVHRDPSHAEEIWPVVVL